MSTLKRAGIYVRTSTHHQTTANQLHTLEEVAQKAGWEIVQVYQDDGISGSRSRDQRPAFKQLHQAIVRREINLVATSSVDRLGRSLQDLISFLNELRAVNCELYIHQQGLDTTTPAGRALFQMLGVFAEFERAIIRERVKAGLDRARAQGKRVGRPRTSPHVIAEIKDRLAAGQSQKAVAIAMKVSIGTVRRAAK